VLIGEGLMKRFLDWKTALAVLSVFVFTTVLLPGFTARVMAEDTPAPAAQATEDAAAAGAAGGAATTAGISAGTIVTVVVVAATALAIALSASNGNGSSTSHH
jgi:hypothetical protein